MIKGRESDFAHQISRDQGQLEGESIALFQILYEDEIDFLESNLQYLIEPAEAIKQYHKDKRRMLGMMALNFMMQLLMTILIIKYHVSIFTIVEMLRISYHSTIH